MRDGAASPSALRVAALRALHQTVDMPPLFLDPLAERMLGPRRDELLELYQAGKGLTTRLRGTLAARAVVAEEMIDEAAARSVRQCVILGAGLDTFAYRNRHPDMQVFEVDHPATQSWKRGLLDDAGIDVPRSLRFVATNFERDDVFRALEKAGFDATQPSVFVILGVVIYISKDSMFDLLRRIGACADVEIVFDYTEPFDKAPEAIRAPYAAVAARLAADGEPWITFFQPAALHQALRDLGFSTITDLDANALQRRFLQHRADGLTVAPLVHVVRARTHDAEGKSE